MKRIISKVDYEMHRLGEIDPKLTFGLWLRICKNDGLIKQAIEVVENKDGEKCFRSPAICHMILSNPWDINKELYDNFVLTLLKNPELNKLSVFRNNTFLYLILLNGAIGFDEWYIELASTGIRNKTKDRPFEIRKVTYEEIPTDGEKVMLYKNEDLDISLNELEVSHYTKESAFSVKSETNYAEIENLVELATVMPNLDKRIVDNINILHQQLLNEQLRPSNEETPKL